MRRITVLLIFLIALNGYSQDPQFSQYYSAPLFLNPAMTGTADCYRVGLNARNQWSDLPGGAFNTGSVFIDLNYPDLRSGFGLLALHDNIGTPRMSSNEISGFYSYMAPISKAVNLRFGLQGTYVSRNLDYSRLVFEDQFNNITPTGNPTIDPMANYRNTQYADVSTGVILFGEDMYWLGFSAHHLTRPQHSFYLESRLPVKYSLHGGFNFYLKEHPKQKNDGVKIIIPTFMFKSQEKFDQLDVGVYYLQSALLLGIWYRGIPLKKDFKIYNRDALDFQIGIRLNDFSFTYSYDFTISRLKMSNTHGSHEVSLVYMFCLDWPKRKKPPRNVRKLPCPDFNRSMRYKKNHLGF